MNDPHVAALHYWIEHGDSVDYDNAEPLDYEDEMAEVHVAKRELILRPREHYASTQEARSALENFIRKWEFDAAVEAGTKHFQLKYMDAEVIDRNPTPPPPGVVQLSAKFRGGIGQLRARLSVRKVKYPNPPEGIELNPDDPTAIVMLSHLDRYHERREPLAAMTYFCLTAMWDSAKAATGTTNAKEAVRRYYAITPNLQGKVSDLSTNKGGSEARKYDGLHQEYSDEERRFLVASIKAFTKRVAEKAANPSANLRMITTDDMPPLAKGP